MELTPPTTRPADAKGNQGTGDQARETTYPKKATADRNGGITSNNGHWRRQTEAKRDLAAGSTDTARARRRRRCKGGCREATKVFAGAKIY